MNELRFAIEVILGFFAVVGVIAVALDRRQRRHQRTYIDHAPSLKDCSRNYTP